MSQPEPLTEQQLDEIDSRTDATRSGPWTLSDDLEGDGYPGHLWVVRTPDSGPDEPDDQAVVISIGDRALGEFIAHAREDVPALLAEVRRQRAELAAVAAFLDEQELAARAFELPTPAWVGAVRAASGVPVAPLAACQPSEAPVEPATATRPPTGRVGDSGEAGR